MTLVTPQEFSAQRLLACYDVCMAAGVAVEIPRRLGGGASGAMLAFDKKMMRRIRHASNTLVVNWARHAEVDPPDVTFRPSDAQRAAGAAFDPKVWMRETIEYLQVAVKMWEGHPLVRAVDFELREWTRLMNWLVTNMPPE